MTEKQKQKPECLTCVDDFTKACRTLTVAFGISGVQATRIMGRIVLFHSGYDKNWPRAWVYLQSTLLVGLWAWSGAVVYPARQADTERIYLEF